jgi:hypothetical protein
MRSRGYRDQPALADSSKGEDGENWFRWVWFWPSFDWLKEPQEAFLAVRD